MLTRAPPETRGLGTGTWPQRPFSLCSKGSSVASVHSLQPTGILATMSRSLIATSHRTPTDFARTDLRAFGAEEISPITGLPKRIRRDNGREAAAKAATMTKDGFRLHRPGPRFRKAQAPSCSTNRRRPWGFAESNKNKLETS